VRFAAPKGRLVLRLIPALLLIASVPAAAQEIVVTGRGLGAASGEDVFDIVTLPRERLEGAQRLEDVLRDVPGFQLFRRSDARTANPTSQGATLRALGGNASSRALLLLDGVPQTDPFGGWVSWPAYDPRRLGAVRVTRGGGSGVNGPGALAGTIELESAGPEVLRGLWADLAYGSRESVDAHAGAGVTLGGGFLALSAAYGRGDGFIPVVRRDRGPADRPSPYEQASLALRAVAPLPGGIELQASGLAFHDSRERGTAFSGIVTQGADAAVRLVGRRWSALGYVQTRDFYNSFASVDPARTAASRTSLQYAVPSTGLGGRLEWRPEVARSVEVRLGADGRSTEGETRELFSYVVGRPTRGRVAGGRTLTFGGFAETAWRGDAVTLTAGGRLDRWSITGGRLLERVLATQAPLADQRYADRSGLEPTGRAGIAWRPSTGLTLRGAAYLGWRLPTLNELYRPFRAGLDATAANPALAPERLAGAEAGLEWRPGAGARIGATLFANRLSGAIANVTLGRGPGTFADVGFVAAGGFYRRRGNLEAIVAQGAEIDAELSRGAWRLSGGVSWVDAEVRASGAAASLAGLRPAQTPRVNVASTLGWHRGGGEASVTARYVAAQYEDDLNRQKLRGAFTLDASARVPVARRVEVEARVENLADAEVQATIGAGGVVERATPRTLWVGVRGRF
jgi:outer membrane receptor protein involved in Fe transport